VHPIFEARALKSMNRGEKKAIIAEQLSVEMGIQVNMKDLKFGHAKIYHTHQYSQTDIRIGN
jgi:hypothetical protein